MKQWQDELLRIAEVDDLHISPLRADGVTLGTPTWIWSVVVDGELFARAYHGQKSTWYQAALKQPVGEITAAGMTKKVTFLPIAGEIDKRIDDAYRKKYKGSPYLNSMISERARSATIKIVPAPHH